MKNKWIAIGLGVLTILVLGGCARSDMQSSAGSAPAAGTSSAGAGTSSAGGAAASGTDASASAAGTQSSAAGSQSADAGSTGADVVSYEGIGNDGAASLPPAEVNQADPEATYDAQNQSGDDAVWEEDGWDGTFVNDAGETLTISQADEHTISFSFAQSGISGSASAEEDEAYYSGDDGNTVNFENAGGSIEVSVMNADGQAEQATISGSFLRQ